MSGKEWLILWAILLVGALLIWIWALRRVYRSFRGLQAEVSSLLGAINSVKASKQTRLENQQESNEEERK